uniref:RING-type domain-containing protein n=1 Tax=Strongyloides stercoralis TaxID=6248 RepID=A0A913HCU4_STRER
MDDYLAEHAPEPTDEEVRLSALRFLSEFEDASSIVDMYLNLKGDQAAKADPKVVASLPKVISENLNSNSQCTICLNYFGENDPNPKAEVIVMPCEHKFHSTCLKAWLGKAATCPLCRKDLPSDDQFLEELKKKVEREQERQADVDELHDSMYIFLNHSFELFTILIRNKLNIYD